MTLQNPENPNEVFAIEIKDNAFEFVRISTTTSTQTETISATETVETITTVITRKVGQRIENFNNV